MAAWRPVALSLVLVAAAGASNPAALRAGSARAGGVGAPGPEGAGSQAPQEGPEEVAEGSGLGERSSAVWPPWVEPGSCNLGQLVFLTVVYGLVLYSASGMIAEGSELLLVVPSIAGLVGSVVLPILGAVPDGMMVLFSGMGERAQAQEQVSVGMGALAGSTVMLLTFPWFIAIYAGSVPIKDGQADYKSRAAGTRGLSSSGVRVDSQIKETAKIMIATTMLYVIIQIPATLEEQYVDNREAEKQAGAESMWAFVGLVSSVCAFAGYIFYCYKQSKVDKEVDQILKMIKAGKFDAKALWQFTVDRFRGQGGGGDEPLLAKDKIMEPVLRSFFKEYDRFPPYGTIEMCELNLLIRDLGFDASKATDEIKRFDNNNDQELNFQEFSNFVESYMKRDDVQAKYQASPAEEPEDEEDPMPDDLRNDDWSTQQRKVKMRACYFMGVGTLLVLLFSDPMVDVLSEWGVRTGVPNFYVSFVLAPFASNASELLAAYSYASKKTPSSITNSLSSLLGAACMNNTFCLGIFLALCYFQGLAWQFTAETIAIMFVQWLIGGVAMLKDYQSRLMAWGVLLCYPGCLLLVYLLENPAIGGLD